MKNIGLAFITIVLLTCSLYAQDSLELRNKVYETDIKTVYLRQTGTNESLPLMNLGQTEALKLQFDQLNTTEEYYNYTFVHCTYDWKPSNLDRMMYLEGEQFGFVENGQSSRSTFQPYIHYKLTFPKPEMKLKLSGNYLLKVYRDFDETDLVITMRFMVIDNKVTIEGAAKRATIAKYRRTDHEIDFTVKHQLINIPNPYQDAKAVLMQNNKWDNTIYNLPPLFSNANLLTYNYESENLFKARNEFRNFDTRSLRAVSGNVQKKFISKSNRKHVVLYREAMKGSISYLQIKDFNGKMVIANRDGTSDVIEGDYAVTYFNLVAPTKLDGEVYIVGEMNHWNLDSSYRMSYNDTTKTYKLKVPLKQGYYNYHYVVKKGNSLDYSLTEGNFFETENEYQVFFYHKNQFLGYYELLGSKFFTTALLGSKK